jgi:pilus assembly protein Flp/PilA
MFYQRQKQQNRRSMKRRTQPASGQWRWRSRATPIGIGTSFLSLRECIMKKNVLARFSRYQRGATAIEYGLIVGLIALGIVTGATALGDGLSQGFTQLSTKVTTLFGVKSGS